MLNIPVGDVVEDTEYDTYVKSNFNIPTSFVRHTKKICDEPDITIDYCVEDEDLVSQDCHLIIIILYKFIYF